jgi:hypothetical protein
VKPRIKINFSIHTFYSNLDITEICTKRLTAVVEVRKKGIKSQQIWLFWQLNLSFVKKSYLAVMSTGLVVGEARSHFELIDRLVDPPVWRSDHRRKPGTVIITKMAKRWFNVKLLITAVGIGIICVSRLSEQQYKLWSCLSLERYPFIKRKNKQT